MNHPHIYKKWVASVKGWSCYRYFAQNSALENWKNKLELNKIPIIWPMLLAVPPKFTLFGDRAVKTNPSTAISWFAVKKMKMNPITANLTTDFCSM